jgi:hypothetical protein
MASGRYGLRPGSWARHKRNFDTPFWPRMRAEDRRLTETGVLEAEEAAQDADFGSGRPDPARLGPDSA